MKLVTLSAAVVFALLVAACGGGDDQTQPAFDGSSSGTRTNTEKDGERGVPGSAGPAGQSGGAAPPAFATSAPAATATPAPRAPAGTPAPGLVPGATSSTALNQVGERKIISNASISLEVSDVQAASNQVRTIAEGLGGFVQQLSTSGDPEKQQSSLTVRVSQPQFFTALDRIKELGKLLGQNVGSSDVSEQYIDLQARLKSAQRQEESYLSLLSKAQSVSDVLTIERELGRIRAEIERFQGQLNFLDRQVALATISVLLSPPSKDPSTPPAASLTVETRDVGRALEEVKGLIATLQGATDSSILVTQDDKERATISFRVFSQDFDRALAAVEVQGEVKSKELREGNRPAADQPKPPKPDAPIVLRLVEDDDFPAWALALAIGLPIVLFVAIGAFLAGWFRRPRLKA